MISVTRITTRKCDQILLTYHLEHDFAAIRTFVECRPRSFALFDWKQSSAWRSSAYVQCIHHTLSFMNAEVTERLPQTQRRGFAQFGCKQCIQRFLGPSSMLQLCLVPSCILTGHYSLLEIRPALLGSERKIEFATLESKDISVYVSFLGIAISITKLKSSSS